MSLYFTVVLCSYFHFLFVVYIFYSEKFLCMVNDASCLVSQFFIFVTKIANVGHFFHFSMCLAVTNPTWNFTHSLSENTYGLLLLLTGSLGSWPLD